METEQVWYYIKDGQKIGPVSLADLQQLQQTKLLGGSDLVWKNGFENWVAIKTVPELNQPAQPAGDNPVVTTNDGPRGGTRPAQPRSAMAGNASGVLGNPLQLMKPLMQPMLMLGVLMVIGSKGCESIHMRWAGRADAIASSERQQFENKYQAMRLAEDADFSEISEKQAEEEEKNQVRWHNLQVGAENARTRVRTMGFAFEAVFVLGTMLLSAALIIAGFTEQGGARWVCLIILAIIVFSVYVGGISWFGSYAGAISSSVPGAPF